MTWAISFTTDFLNTFLNLPKSVQDKFSEIYKILEEDPVNQYSVKLKGVKDTTLRIRVTRKYRLFYKYGNGWVKLLQIVKKEKDNIERLKEKSDGDVPPFFPHDFDDEELEVTTKDQTSLLSLDQLQRWLIPEEYQERLLSLQHEDELLDVEIPNVYLCRIIDNIYPSSLEEIENKPEFELDEPGKLTRFASGEIIEFFLKLTSEQKRLLDDASDVPILVKGGPGTGKSTLALYRVAKFIKSGTKKILFTTHTEALINSSKQLLQTLLGQPLEEITVEVKAVDSLAIYYYVGRYGQPTLATETARLLCLESAIYSTNLNPSVRKSILRLGHSYLLEEFSIVIEARKINDLDNYRNTNRFGRKYNLNRVQREAIWLVYGKWKELIETAGLVTIEQIRIKALENICESKEKPYDAVVIDEAQDLSPVALQFLVSLVSSLKNVYLTADVEQSLYQRSFSWNEIRDSIEVKGVEQELRRSFRNTEQIGRACRDIFDSWEIDDFSELQGNKPQVFLTDDLQQQAQKIKDFCDTSSRKFKLPISSCVILVPTQEYGEFIAQQLSFQFDVEARYISSKELGLTDSYIKVMNIENSKGLEFPFVVVLGLKEGMLPNLPNDIPEEDKEEIWEQQRRLFYVACSRAMKALLICGSQHYPSSFLNKLSSSNWWEINK